MKEYRYLDAAKTFGEALMADLAKVAVAEQDAPHGEGGLERFLDGDTALRSVESLKAASAAAVPGILAVHAAGLAVRDVYAAKLASLDSFLAKEAASRLDKEVAAGTVRYSDVDKRIPHAMGHSGIAKAISRHEAHEPAARSASDVARKRKLDTAVFNNAFSEKAAPGTHTLKKDMIPGMGPGTTFDRFRGGGRPTVHSDEHAGQFMRGLSTGKFKDQVKTMEGTMWAPENFTPRKPVDATLNRAILEHEIGEAHSARRPTLHMHASHAGPEPLLRENLIAAGDPEAVHMLKKVRNLGHDDRLMAKTLRGLGHHPDAPLPLGGKHERAAETALVRNSGRLDRSTKGKLLGESYAMARHDIENNVENHHDLARVIDRNATTPAHVKAMARDIAESHIPVAKAWKAPSLTGKVRALSGAARTALTHYGALSKYLKP